MVRWVVYGAGAVGGTVGARLAASGHDVVFIARGRHLEAMQRSGLRIDSPERSVTIEAAVARDPVEARVGVGDVVVLAMKSQHTVAALDELRSAAPSEIPIVCLQNGVNNEREALRRFANVTASASCARLHIWLLGSSRRTRRR